ncbi:hypothetical protein KSP39_PZI000467 [Platanthera zijinensis]|uniref:Glutaredoxin domain-containing protein n=1 Tax=Platanthera zijinensis TaxID=2320716 RepID=A0AAP0C1Y2_9ASPA
MKAMKGRILNKLQSIPQMGQLKQGRILQLKSSNPKEVQTEIMDATRLIREAGKEEEENKENIKPVSAPGTKQRKDESTFRRPDPNSTTLFDPNLLAAFEQAVKDYLRIYELLKQLKETEESTSIRGVRKTFEGCSAIRFLLQSSKVMFYERDVSIHREFRAELQRLLGPGEIPPRLFIDGRCIGGAEEVLGMHEEGRLMPVLEEMPRDQSGGVKCWRCGGGRFLVCESCHGGRKMYHGGGGVWGDCGLCNENGLVVCPICCC